jgi:Tfp pilus assembly protein PilV
MIATKHPRKLECGFTIIEFLVASAVMMMTIMGITHLISVELLNLQLTRQRLLLSNAANSELARLLALDPDDSDLSTDAPHSKETTTENKIPITIDWTVTEETIDENGDGIPDNDRIGILRVEMKARMMNRPVNNRVYVGRKIYYK